MYGLLSLVIGNLNFHQKPRTLWLDTAGFPVGDREWIKPYIDF